MKVYQEKTTELQHEKVYKKIAWFISIVDHNVVTY